MARPRTGRSRTKLALKLALISAGAAFLGSLITGIGVQQNYVRVAADVPDTVSRGWMIAVGVALVAAALVGITAYVLGGQLGARLTELGLAVAKLGRGGTEVRIRQPGNDEITALGQALQYLANDLQEMARQQQAGAALVSMDPLVRQFRDRALPNALPAVEGFEIDAALSPGTRGGTEYFGGVVGEADATTIYLVAGDGAGTMAAVAGRMARDELHRALEQKAAPRRALAHANKVLHKNLPKGVCAKATLLELSGGNAKLYMAGARSGALQCARGELNQVQAEGIALGLDEGAVFEKSLRPQEITMAPGTRVLLVNEAALRVDEFQDLVKQHSPKHTAMFMNMVLGAIEEDAGSEGLREDLVVLTAKKGAQAS